MAMCENLSEHLEAIRKEKGKTITAFSEEIGVSRSSLQCIIGGKSNPRIDTIEYIGKRLDVDPLTLLMAEPSRFEQQFWKRQAERLCAMAALPEKERQQIFSLVEQIIKMLGE